MLYARDLVLQKQQIPFPKVRQNAVAVLGRDPAVGAAKNDDAVLPLGIHLNDGMSRSRAKGGHKVAIHTALLHKILEPCTFCANGTGMVYLCACISQGYRLIQSFASYMTFIGQSTDRFSRGGDFRNTIHMVDIQ